MLKGVPGEVVGAMVMLLRERGVELMSGIGGLTSSAHTDADVEQTLAAFDDALGRLAGTLLATL